MRRKLAMLLLATGAVLGFGAGFARLHAGPGYFGRGRHGDFERRVADACTESALRVYGQKAGVGPKP
ncbi:MAG: hypothetical protein EOO73_32455 [Myxococcales bacterium]|nr:MAG: hypothetical protein EOO73_32455 [Myxococcales bacterium]